MKMWRLCTLWKVLYLKFFIWMIAFNHLYGLLDSVVQTDLDHSKSRGHCALTGFYNMRSTRKEVNIDIISFIVIKGL